MAMTTQAIEPRMELEQNLHMYRQMAKIRAFEEQVHELYKSAKMPGLAHLYVGEEGVAVGVCEALRRDDFITSTHRGHGHCLAKGATVNRMFAELLGKESGYCRGKGGSMHIADPETGNLGANAIVGGSAGIATGAALSAKMRGSGQVAVCFFGDGALGQGLVYECMNMASLWKLPVIYVCENNLYGEYTPCGETVAGEILARARAFGIHAETVDGHRVEVGSDRVIVTPTGNRVVLLVVHVDAEYVAGGPFNRRDRFLRDVAPALADHGVAELLRFPNLLDPWT